MANSLGPFQLLEPLAQGGMAQIWKAEHRGTPVAVKFVTHKNARDSNLFAEEVRAHARLQHPGILTVLDLGVTESESVTQLPIGTPWMALEYSSGGDLSQWLDTLEWEGLRLVLLSVLDALGHAHAHGVVHRDLKPANILLSTAADLRPGLKLADFGIAHIMGVDSQKERGPVMGTAMTIAPEQCFGAFRQLGPWTDLYSLGCLVTRVVTGRYPFQGMHARSLLIAHTSRTPPPMVPRFPVPDGLAAWVDRLLQKQPRDRFSSCADAAVALLEMPSMDRASEAIPPSLLTDRTRILTTSRWAWGDAPRTHQGVAPLAKDWRQPAPPPRPIPLVDAGLQLFPLRPRRTVGREDAADRVWATLRQCRAQQQPRCIVLQGAPGVGISHFGSWIGRKAEALGAAWLFTIRPAPEDGPDDAIRRFITNTLRARGLAGEALHRVIGESLQLWTDSESPELQQILAGVVEGTITGHAVRRGATRKVLHDRLERRAGILWIDDAQWCPDGTRFVLNTLRHSQDLPLLMILGAGDRSDETLEAILGHDRAEVLRLDHLTPTECNTLIHSTLPCSAGVQARVAEDSDGLPSVIVHHLAHLIEQDALVASAEGYKFRAPNRFVPAADPIDAARQRCDTLLSTLDPEQRFALVMAAVFGEIVPRDDWAAAVDGPITKGELKIGAAVARSRLETTLLRRGMAFEAKDSWGFKDRALRRILLEQTDPSQLRTAQRRVAAVLGARAHTQVQGFQAGQLLRASGDLEGALEAYSRALYRPWAGAAMRLGALNTRCDEALQMLDELGLGPDDPRREPYEALRLRGTFDLPSTHAHTAAMLERATRLDWPLALALSAGVLAHRTASDPGGAFDAHLATAQAAIERVTPSPLAGDAEFMIARALYVRARYDEVVERLRPLLRKARRFGWSALAARVGSLESNVRKRIGPPIPTSERLAMAEEYIAGGHLVQAGSLMVDAADAATDRGDLDASDALNERARALIDLIGLATPATLFNQCVNALIRQDATAARRWLDAGIATDPSRNWHLSIACLEVEWACVTGDPEVIQERMLRFERAMNDLGRPITPSERSTLERSAAHLQSRQPELATALHALLAI